MMKGGLKLAGGVSNVVIVFTSGVSNSYWSEGQIPNYPRQHFKGKKYSAGQKTYKTPQIRVILTKIYQSIRFLDERGPHKCNWWAACLRSLFYILYWRNLCLCNKPDMLFTVLLFTDKYFCKLTSKSLRLTFSMS